MGGYALGRYCIPDCRRMPNANSHSDRYGHAYGYTYSDVATGHIDAHGDRYATACQHQDA